MPAPRPEVPPEVRFQEVTGQDLNTMNSNEALALLQRLPESSLDQRTRMELQNHINSTQKNFFRRALENTGKAIAWPFKVAGKIINAPFRLIEMVPIVGKPASRILKVVLIAVAAYYGWQFVRELLARWNIFQAGVFNAAQHDTSAAAAQVGETVVTNPYLRDAGQAAGGGTFETGGNTIFGTPNIQATPLPGTLPRN